MSQGEFVEQHYASHAKHFDRELVDEERIRISASWFDDSTADYWRHARGYECAELLSHQPSAVWLTVGDGRWGLDSMRIGKKGFSSVLPTDISETLLRAAKERGLIEKYAVENAEKLTFDDLTFDYVFCKEALHHFPRPYVALYEMLRVARLGVFLIEPNDCWSVEAHGSSSAAQQGALPRLRHNTPEWEPSGNYVYLLSRREIEKIALGLNLPQIVVKGLNDHYVKGCEFEPADESRSAIFREIVQNVSAKDDLCRRGLADYNMLMAGFIKRRMDAQTRERFCAAGWDVADLPANPYIPRKD